MVPKPGRHVSHNSVGMFFRTNNRDESLESGGRGAKKRPTPPASVPTVGRGSTENDTDANPKAG